MQGRKGRMAKRFKSIKIYEESYGYLIALKAEAEAETRKNYTLAEAFHALVKSSYDNMLKAKSGRRPAAPFIWLNVFSLFLPAIIICLIAYTSDEYLFSNESVDSLMSWLLPQGH